MFFIGGGGLGGRGALPANNTPAQRKTPLNPPPPKPPLFKFGSGGVFSMISDFRESRPPGCACAPRPRLYVQHELGNLQLHACEACPYAGDTVKGGNLLLLYTPCSGVSVTALQSPPVSD